jgi:uncharacterized protein YggE
MEIQQEYKKIFSIAVVCLLIVASLHFLVGSFSHLGKGGMMGGFNDSAENIITVTGYGEVNAIPDIASVSFTISKDATTAKEAQNQVAQIEGKVLEFLKTSNILDKDIKTTNSSFYPKYEYKYSKLMPCNEYGCPPSNGQNVIVGYTASESITVKIRNTDDAGKIIEGLSGLGVSNLYGPDFTIDDEDGLKEIARKNAIDDAKMKAQKLAKDLGVRLGDITSFNESGNYPTSMMYLKNEMADSAGSSAPSLPKGENTITSDVTITYEIR